MHPLTRGIYTARLATSQPDLDTVLALRALCFRGGLGRDEDGFDARCQHMLITGAGGQLVGCFRTLFCAPGDGVLHSYSAQVYDLSPLTAYPRPVLELGRFCIHPVQSDPDILRLAWAALAQMVDDLGAGLLMGCSSFAGADPAPHLPALGYLAARHLAPVTLRVGPRASARVPLQGLPAPQGRPALPSLLQTYIAMGAHVSDHAVIDHDLNTLHVFTTLDIAAIPPNRARALRALAT